MTFCWCCGPEDWRKRLNQLLDDFQHQCRRFYRSEHLEAGCLSCTESPGRAPGVALLSLSIGVVHLYPQSLWISGCQPVGGTGLAGQAPRQERGRLQRPRIDSRGV